jgi:hypothetical protein
MPAAFSFSRGYPMTDKRTSPGMWWKIGFVIGYASGWIERRLRRLL